VSALCVGCGGPTGRRSPTGHPVCERCRPTDLADAISEAEGFLSRFVVFTDRHQLTTCALFAAYSHVFDVFDVAVYLAVTAPEKQSGKTRLLEVLEPLAGPSIRTSNISPAAVYRVVHDRHPVLFVDEADTQFSKGERAEELRGLINAGHRKGNPAYRMKGARGAELAEFDTFCPKVIAAIGDLPDTIADRCIPIRLQRKRPDETVGRFRIRYQVPEGEEIGSRIARIVAEFRDIIADAEPDIPKGLSDRAEDVWEPLLAVADAAGGSWPQRARDAAARLSDAAVTEDGAGVRLLADIRDIWRPDEDRLATATILERLHSLDEAPWADWFGKPITAHKLGRLLGRYGIFAQALRLPTGDRLKGFERVAFEDAWSRYLTPPDVSKRDNGTTPVSIDESEDSQSVTNRKRHALENPENPTSSSDVTPSRFKTGESVKEDENSLEQAPRKGQPT